MRERQKRRCPFAPRRTPDTSDIEPTIAHGVDRCVELGLREGRWADQQKQLLDGDIHDLLGVAEQVSHRLGSQRT